MIILLLGLFLLPGCWFNPTAVTELVKDEEKAVVDFVENELDAKQTTT